MIAIAFEESLSASRAIPHLPLPSSSFATPTVASNHRNVETTPDDNVRRTLHLDQSYTSSNDRSQRQRHPNEAVANTSSQYLDFSDDSSMNIDDE
jgi:hypothetical protein